MPGLNKTGPLGQGPLTGRRVGCCNNFGAKTATQASQSNNEATNPNDSQGIIGRGAGRFLRKRGLGMQNRFRGSF